MSAEFLRSTPADVVSPPTPDTYYVLQSALLRVESLPEATVRSRAISVCYLGEPFDDPEQQERLFVYADHRTTKSKSGATLSLSGELQFRAQVDSGVHIFDGFIHKREGQDRDVVNGVVSRVSHRLLESEAQWLQSVWAQAQSCPSVLAGICTERLTESSSVPVQEYTVGGVDVLFQNGSSIKGSWRYGNETFWRNAPPNYTQQQVTLTAAGKQHTYTRCLDGTESLEVTSKKTVAAQSASFSPRTSLTARHEARQIENNLGVNQLTEGKVREFNAELAAALGSGQDG